jgi:hypothetical protein
MDFDNQMHAMSAKFNEGYGKCMSLKKDDEIKNCFRSLISDNMSKLQNFYHEFEGKFENLNKKL